MFGSLLQFRHLTSRKDHPTVQRCSPFLTIAAGLYAHHVRNTFNRMAQPDFFFYEDEFDEDALSPLRPSVPLDHSLLPLIYSRVERCRCHEQTGTGHQEKSDPNLKHIVSS